jgi:hypothetical protein
MMLRSIRQLFGSFFREPEVVILPPLAAGRTKPFPRKPHHTRRMLVRSALDAAPAGLTDRQLIEYVRERTGTGCSFRTICAWRKQGTVTSGTTNHRESRGGTGNHTPSASLVFPRGLILCLLFVLTSSCHPTAPAFTLSSLSSPPSRIEPLPSVTPSPDHPVAASPKILEIKLTINSPRDLNVRQGDSVEAGQVLASRSHERRRLLAQRRMLDAQAQQIEAQIKTAEKSIALLEWLGSDLPPASFASEQAAISRAEAEAAITARKVAVQKRRLAALPAAIPPGFDNQAVESHEAAKLSFVQDSERQALAEIELQKAKLISAKEARAFEEKRHAVETARQLLTAQSQQQQAVIARSQLLAQIATIDLSLAQLAEVCAPFSGSAKRIEWENQHDQTITVVLYLAVSGQ